MNTTNKASTRAALLQAATVTLAKNPGASLNDVAEAAGVGRATLYRYFASREALLHTLALEAIRKTDEAIAPIRAQELGNRETLKQIVEALIPLGDAFHFLMSELAIYSHPEVSAAYERHFQSLETLVNAIKAEGGFSRDVPTAWGVITIDTLIWSAWSSVESGYIARRDAAPIVFRTLFKGLAP